MTACEFCAAGTYNPHSTNLQYSCESCINGKFSSSDRKSCQTCELGFAVESSSSDTCQKCGPGFASLSGQFGCQECSNGKYSFQPSNTQCLGCGAGFAAPDNVSSCEICTAGRYQGQAISEQYSCTECDQGQFTTVSDEAKVSTDLDEGDELVNRFSCPEGSQSNDAMCESNGQDCCAPGAYGDNPQCKDGKYRNNHQKNTKVQQAARLPPSNLTDICPHPRTPPYPGTLFLLTLQVLWR